MCVSVCIIMCVFIYVCEHLEFQEMKRVSGHSLVVEHHLACTRPHIQSPVPQKENEKDSVESVEEDPHVFPHN